MALNILDLQGWQSLKKKTKVQVAEGVAEIIGTTFMQNYSRD